MEVFSWFLITFLMCHLSRGTFIQSSGPVGHSDPTRFQRSSRRRAQDPDEGSGLHEVGATSQKLMGEAGASEEVDWAKTRPEPRTGLPAGTEVLMDGALLTEPRQLTDARRSGAKEGGHVPKRSVQTKVFTNRDPQRPKGPCGPAGLEACVVLRNLTGTNLLWDDMSRTLAFAWELHVFGCAALFLLMAALAAVGTAGARGLPPPLRWALMLANCFLFVGGASRGVLLLLDPYGSHQVLSRAQLAALHNVPMLLLLWTHVVLILLVLGPDAPLVPARLRRPHVAGAFGASHCSVLLMADLHWSSWASPGLPLLLQTLSLCWSLLFCSGTLVRSLSRRRARLGPSEPRRSPSDRRLSAVCSLLGVLCCGLQVYSLLWLYGFLGNWRRFGWGWWITQFWARILELAWGFFLLVLGSWIFWTPRKCRPRSDGRWSSTDWSKGAEQKNLWAKVVSRLSRGPLRESEKKWEDLIPSRWGKYNLSRANAGNLPPSPYRDLPLSSESRPQVQLTSDPQAAALLWQKVGERECLLSLIELDMRPPSPVDLRRSIHAAPHGGHVLPGGLFSDADQDLYGGQPISGGLFSRPSSWSPARHAMDTSSLTFPPNYVSYGWTLDSDSISMSLDHFQVGERPLTPGGSLENLGSLSSGSSIFTGEEWTSIMAALMKNRQRWAEEDVTDL